MEKIDFSKFDVQKLFDVDQALTHMEETSRTASAMITDKTVRQVVETISAASFEFARAQASAAKTYAEAVKKAIQI